MNQLKPYPSYRDSGVPWLGELPEHWEVMPNRTIFKEVKEKGHPDEEMLSVTIAQGVIKQTSLLSDTSKKDSSNEDKSKYKLVCPGDIAYNKMRAWQGAVGASGHRGIVSPAYIVVRPRETNNPRYFHYLFRTPAFMSEAERWSYGISSDQWSLRPEEFKQIYCFVPSLPEQQAIVRYLNYLDKRIRRYVHTKKRLIALLNEQKQAIIHQAVTRGLDPNVKLKPSEVEWLGEIPEHWEIKQLKYWARINQNTLSEDTATDYEFDYIDIGTVGAGYLIKRPDRIRFINAPSRARRILQKNDTIVSTVRTYLKSVYFISEEISNLIASTGFAVLTPQPELVPEYFGSVAQDRTFIDQVMANSVGVAYPAIAETRLASIKLAISPNIFEQQTISKYITSKTQPLVEAIAKTRHEIDLLNEYRTRLMADVVTGKLDVREAAANLPVEAEEEAIDESEEYANIEEYDNPEELVEETIDVG
jgi:type I restriction enzyme S subunit